MQSGLTFPSVDLSRRRFLGGAVAVGGLAVLSACGGGSGGSSGSGSKIDTSKVDSDAAKALQDIFGPGG